MNNTTEKGAVKKVPQNRIQCLWALATKICERNGCSQLRLQPFCSIIKLPQNENYRNELYTNPAEITSGYGKNY